MTASQHKVAFTDDNRPAAAVGFTYPGDEDEADARANARAANAGATAFAAIRHVFEWVANGHGDAREAKLAAFGLFLGHYGTIREAAADLGVSGNSVAKARSRLRRQAKKFDLRLFDTGRNAANACK